MISLLIIACNEEHRLAACVASARSVVDEVVIIVQESTDGTFALARKLADRVISHPRYGWCEPSRKAGIAACQGDYILNLDADEVLTEYGRIHLRAWCAADFYTLLRVTTVDGVEVERRPHGRLFKRAKVTASPNIHTEFEPTKGTRVCIADGDCVILHAKTAAEQRADDARYAGLAAKKTWHNIEGWFNFQDVYDLAVREARDGAAFVEVGAWLGKSTAYMADTIRQSGKGIAFHTVDTWEGCPNDPTGNLAAAMAKEGRSLHSRFLRNIAECGLTKYVMPLRMASPEAAEHFDNHSLEFVYIDADHSFDAVWADIAAWLPKVKPGGILAGHDFDWGTVADAVRKHFGSNYERVGQSSWLHHTERS